MAAQGDRIWRSYVRSNLSSVSRSVRCARWDTIKIYGPAVIPLLNLNYWWQLKPLFLCIVLIWHQNDMQYGAKSRAQRELSNAPNSIFVCWGWTTTRSMKVLLGVVKLSTEGAVIESWLNQYCQKLTCANTPTQTTVYHRHSGAVLSGTARVPQWKNAYQRCVRKTNSMQQKG